MCDRLLRSKVFAGDLFPRLLGGMRERIEAQWTRHRRRVYLAGVAKHSKVLARYRLEGGLLENLVDARRRITNDLALLREMLANARKVTPGLAEPVLQAIGTLRVENWVYLKDTRSYAVFLDSSGEHALGVRALTQRLRDVVGTSGVLLEAGIVRYCGYYVCDGLVSDVVLLGGNYLRSFTSR